MAIHVDSAAGQRVRVQKKQSTACESQVCLDMALAFCFAGKHSGRNFGRARRAQCTLVAFTSSLVGKPVNRLGKAFDD